LKKKAKIAVIAASVVVAIGVLLAGPLKDLRNLYRHGLLQSDSGEDRRYAASREANLKSMFTALNLYQDSEGRYPEASGWMDAIQQHLRTSDMPAAEAEKKLVRPNLDHPSKGQYGYAINDAIAGKYSGDIKDPNTPMVFESQDLSRNAHGSPAGQHGRLAVTMAGKISRH
jgi:hypothetical protein